MLPGASRPPPWSWCIRGAAWSLKLDEYDLGPGTSDVEEVDRDPGQEPQSGAKPHGEARLTSSRHLAMLASNFNGLQRPALPLFALRVGGMVGVLLFKKVRVISWFLGT